MEDGGSPEVITGKLKYTGRADKVLLFLAKTKDGAWLDGAGAAAVVLDEHGHPQGFKQMDPLLWLKNAKYFGTNFTPEEGQIHVLVVVPDHLAADPKVLELQEALLRHTLMNEPSSTSARTQDFKENLIVKYQGDMGKYQGNQMLRCMLLNLALPSELVIASHLFRREHEFLADNLMGFTNIDDVNNGLLLFKPLDHAFDHHQISFIYYKDDDEFRLKIFDPSLRQQLLFDKLDDRNKNSVREQKLPKKWRRRDRVCAPGTDFNIKTTFGAIENQPLCFKSVEHPYKRCLNLQARLARKKAVEAKWIQADEDDFEDFWSEGMTFAEKMDFFNAREG